jgi:hypothetical protein
LKQIFLKQKAAVRILANAKYNAHTEHIFKNLNILPFPLFGDFFRLQLMQRFVQGYLPISFDNTWITNCIRQGDEAQVQLRDDEDLHIPRARTTQFSFHPLILLPKTWEEFPEDQIKFIRNKADFNFEFKKYLY